MAGVDQFGKYQLLEKLGQGGMAEVFLAVAPGLAGFSKKLVLKRVLPELASDHAQVEMFLDEARLAARLEHPNICQVFDLGEHDEQYFIVMEHVPGVTFSKVIDSFHRRGERVPIDVGLRAIAQLLEALEYAHSLKDDKGRALNLVHRDVTPTNVMLTPQGSVKLLDFGIARATTRKHHTQVGITKGKLGYMSPEQCRAQALDNRSDLFAVGTMLYVLATGRQPYATKELSTETYEDMVLARFPRPGDVADVPADLEGVILKAMAMAPKDRYRTAFDMLQDVEQVAKRLGVSLGPNHLAQVVQELSGARSHESASTAADVETRERPSAPQRKPATPPPPPAASVETRVAASATLLQPRGPSEAARDTRVPMPDVATLPQAEAATRLELEKVPDRPRPTAPRSGMAIALSLAAVAIVVLGVAGWRVASRRPAPLVTEVVPIAIEAPPVENTVPTVVVAAPEPVPAPSKEPTTIAEPPPAEPPTVASPIVPAPPVDQPTKPRDAPPKVSPRPTARPVEAPPPAPSGPSGLLTVTSTPQAQVRYGNRLIGPTPLEFSLPVGTQRVELLYPGQPPRRLLVNIVAGKRTPLTDAL